MRASQTASYDKHENYESMETLGDCVLKFVVSQYLVNRGKKGKWRNESYLTEQRMKLVGNKYLFLVAFFNNLHYFFRNFK